MAAILVTLVQAKDHLQLPTMPDGDPGEADMILKLAQAEHIVLHDLKAQADPLWVSPETTPGNITSAILLVLGLLYRGDRGDDSTKTRETWDAVDRLLVGYRDPALA